MKYYFAWYLLQMHMSSPFYLGNLGNGLTLSVCGHQHSDVHSLSIQGTKLTKNGLGKLLKRYMNMGRDSTVLDVSGSKSLTGLEPPVYADL